MLTSVDRTKAAVRCRKLRNMSGRCKMCGGRHTTKQHLESAIAARGPRTDEHCRKLSLACKGRRAWNKGLKGSVPGFSRNSKIEKERRKKISDSQRKVNHWWCRGKSNWRWKGTDYSKDNADFRRLRSIVIVRDKKTCQQCGRTCNEVRIVVHHIDHDGLHNWLDNLIVLCHPDNVRAEHEKYKVLWEKKFSRRNKKLSYNTISIKES